MCFFFVFFLQKMDYSHLELKNATILSQIPVKRRDIDTIPKQELVTFCLTNNLDQQYPHIKTLVRINLLFYSLHEIMGFLIFIIYYYYRKTSTQQIYFQLLM